MNFVIGVWPHVFTIVFPLVHFISLFWYLLCVCVYTQLYVHFKDETHSSRHSTAASGGNTGIEKQFQCKADGQICLSGNHKQCGI